MQRGNNTECSSGAEHKDIAHVFCNCVLHKENYTVALALAS